MKKFVFQLNTVMNYKNQRLEGKKGEHGQAIEMVNKQAKKIQELLETFGEINTKFNRKKMDGITVIEAVEYSGFLHRLEGQRKKEELHLLELKKVEELKRSEVVEMKIETATLEKLKEKKWEEYNKDVQKSEELFIEEFISRQRLS